MLKSLNNDDIQVTPFLAKKSWNVQNIRNEGLILWISGSLSGPISHTYLDYEDGSGTPITNSFASLALQQQGNSNQLNYQRGISGSGTFYPTTSEFYNSASLPVNPDGTFMKVVYDVHRAMFYNPNANQTQIFGLERTDINFSPRQLTNNMDVFSFKKTQFGEKIVPNSVLMKDTFGEINYTIRDDGNTNLILSGSYFSKFQTIRFESEL